MSRKYLLVGNPTARTGRARGRIDRALAKMRARGVEVHFLATAPGGATVGLVHERVDAEPFDAVIYLGGDGTFAEVAKGLIASSRSVPMGMLPSGTANDQGKSFGVSAAESALERNLDVIDEGNITNLDVGCISRLDDDNKVMDQDLFFDSCGFGMNPDILAARNRDRETVAQIPLLRDLYRDELVYAGATLKKYLASWVEPTKFDAEILSYDGDEASAYTYGGLTDLVISNTPIYGGRWVFVPECEPDDGRFEVVPVQRRRDWFSKAIRDLAVVPISQADLDEIGITHCEGFTGGRFEIRLTRPQRQLVASQIDGEEWLLGDRFRVEVMPRRLPLITPIGWFPPWKAYAQPA